MPRSDLPKLKRWTDAVIANQDQSNSEARQLELAHTICELHRYAVAKVEEFRKQPAECLLSDFANTKGLGMIAMYSINRDTPGTSYSTTGMPRERRRKAVVRPVMPPPTTATSWRPEASPAARSP